MALLGNAPGGERVDEFSYWETAEAEIPWEHNRSYQRLASEASQVGSEKNLSRSEFLHAVHRLYDAYGDFLYATNQNKTEPEDQVHWHNHFRYARLGKKIGEPTLSPEMLSEAVFKYLKGSIRVPMLDRGLIDALIAQETFAFIDTHAGRSHFMTHLGCWGTWLILFVIFQVLVANKEPNWTRIIYGLSAVALIILVIWACAIHISC